MGLPAAFARPRVPRYSSFLMDSARVQPATSATNDFYNTNRGNNNWTMASRFTVNSPIVVTHLCAIDQPPDGFTGTVFIKLTACSNVNGVLRVPLLLASFSGSNYPRSPQGGYLVQPVQETVLTAGTYQVNWWTTDSVSNKVDSNSGTQTINTRNGIAAQPRTTSVSTGQDTQPTFGGTTAYAVAGTIGYREYADPPFSLSSPQLMYTNAQARALNNSSWFDTSIGVAPGAGGTWNFYAGNYLQTRRSTGTATALASGGAVTCTMSNTGTLDYYYGGAVYQDPATQRDILFLHEEEWNGDQTAFYGTIGISVNSAPYSTAFTRLGTIIRPNIAQDGVNTATVGSTNLVVRDGYMYVYYNDRLSSGTFVACAVARAPLATVVSEVLAGTCPTFYKYNNLAWTSPGIGGAVTALDASTAGNSNPCVVYIPSRKIYAKVQQSGSDTASRIYLSYSLDGLSWGPTTIIENDAGEAFYPVILGAGADPRVITNSFHVLYTKSALGGFNRWQDLQIKYVTVTLT
jgi:hypothetical protein